MQKKPLEGIRILDLSRLLPGPLATMFLADMGAEVIKIENPAQPDYVRNFPPVYEAEGKEFSANYLAFNRSKKSLTLDYTQSAGKEIFWQLLKTADVVVEQFRPGYLDKLGIGYSEASKINEKIIYVSITGYGQTGTYSHLAGHDLNYLSHSGVLSLIGEAGKAPSLPAVQLADIAGGSYMAIIGTLAALQARIHTHKGQHVDVSMTEGIMPLLMVPFTHYQATKQAQRRGETPLAGMFPNYNVYMCKDGKYISFAALEPKFWIKFCNVVQKPEFLGFAMPQDTKQMQQNKATLQAFFLTQDREYWLQLGKEHDLLISPVYEIDEIEKDMHLQERNMFLTLKHPQIGDITTLGFPIKFSETPASPTHIAPELGENSFEILQSLGFSIDEIENLKAQKVI
ncbi:MAG: CaiB/BaiF CoA-transferase family protein [Raineya sp.]|nr:CoA transferase [Raineya sp.]MDW8296682.1 CaiB/BaiF CoA-transferase family protein [Raineya sp.]